MIVVTALIIMGVAGLLTYGYFESDGFQTTTNSIAGNVASHVSGGVEGLYKFSEDCNEVNDCISFFAPKKIQQTVVNLSSENDELDSEIIDTNEDGTDPQYYENGTQIPTTSYVTGVVGDTSFSKTHVENAKQITEKVGSDGQMLVQIGNIATIQGQIKILDPQTGEIVEPRIYKYWMTIDCAETVEFCTLPATISRRSTTTVGGTFIEKWATNFNNNEGLYDVKILAESETTDPFGKKYSVEGLIKIELYS